MTPEDQFLALAEEIDVKTASVRCSREEYMDGLKIVIGQLKTALQAAEECDD